MSRQRWILTSQGSSFVVVWWNDVAVRETARHVAPFKMRLVVDECFRARSADIMDLYQAVETQKKGRDFSDTKNAVSESLMQKRIYNAFVSGRLVALTPEIAAPCPQLEGAQSTESQSPPRIIQKQSPADKQSVVQGIVQWSGAPVLRLRARPSRDATAIRELPFNTPLAVLERSKDGWLKVLTRDNRVGYVASEYVWFPPKHRLPEPDAQLYRVPKYSSSTGAGTAIGIAQAHFKNMGWGHDLGFYVAILAAANGREIPRTTKGWLELRFKEGEYIWIPSARFANSLRVRVSSGSYSYELGKGFGVFHFLDKIAGIGKEFLKGVDDAIAVVEESLERLNVLVKDFAAALERSVPHIWPEMKIQAGEATAAILSSLLDVAKHMAKVLVGGVLAGAAVGALVGGIGAVAGAKIGADLALLWLEIEGLVFIAQWVSKSGDEIFSALGKFLESVQEAHGDEARQEAAGVDLAKAIGVFVKVLLEALAIWATAKGIGATLKGLKGTALDKAAVTSWLSKRVAKNAPEGTPAKSPSSVPVHDAKRGTNSPDASKTGGSQKSAPSENGGPTNGPKNESNGGTSEQKPLDPNEWRRLLRKLAEELGISEEAVESLLEFGEPATLRVLKGGMGSEGLRVLARKSAVIRETFFKILRQVDADAVGREQLLEAMRLNREKGSTSDKVLQSALTAYLAFLERYGSRVSGDFMSRFLREHSLADPKQVFQATAERHLAEDVLADKTSLGRSSHVEALPESKISSEDVPEFRAQTSSGPRLAECKAIGEPGKPLSKNGIMRNIGDAHSQLRDQSGRTGEVDGFIRIDGRNAENTNFTATEMAEFVSSKISTTSQSTRWVEVIYKNVEGQTVRVLIERGTPRFKVHSQEVMK